ncbi:MAG: hypothetical protein AAFQ98_12520, partial [Bacteroidota bacterium]
MRTQLWIFRVILGFSVFGACLSYGQSIQWASGLNYAYNEFEPENWSGKQVIGPPNSVLGGLDKQAFRIKSESGIATLIMDYAEPQKVTHIIIIENYLPGRVTDVSLTDANGAKYPVYKVSPTQVLDPYRALVITVPPTEYLVKQVELNINTVTAPGWVQIDAIGLMFANNLSEVNEALKPFGNFSVSEEVSFSSEKEPLNSEINTEFREAKPLITPDGKSLFFVRQFHP